MNLSIVIPLLNEAESLPELTAWIEKVVDKHHFTYEILFIDDGSTDASWKVIQTLSSKNPCVKGIKFRRNYGKSAALNVGFQAVKGDVVFTMDADLQDSPDEIPELYRMVMEDGYDIVSGWKEKRYDPLSKTIPTKLFNAITRWISKINLNDFNCGLKAYRQNVVKSIEVYGEMHRYIPVIAKWSGFKKIGEKSVQHQARKYGTTKFGLERFLFGFLDLLSITFVGRFGKRPMHFFGTLGFLMFFGGGMITIWLIIEKLWKIAMHVRVRDVTDQPLFFMALTMSVIGTQFFLAGFLGELVSRNSPIRNAYIIEDTI
jgi:glycosyltransferase involved in cell wall biosynthesis